MRWESGIPLAVTVCGHEVIRSRHVGVLRKEAGADRHGAGVGPLRHSPDPGSQLEKSTVRHGHPAIRALPPILLLAPAGTVRAGVCWASLVGIHPGKDKHHGC